jgi:hypothetical protein
MVTWILYLAVGLLAAALITQGVRLLTDPVYRNRIFDRKASEDRRTAERLSRYPGLVRWLTEPHIKALRADAPDGLRRSGWYLLWIGSVFGVGCVVGVIATLVN